MSDAVICDLWYLYLVTIDIPVVVFAPTPVVELADIARPLLTQQRRFAGNDASAADAAASRIVVFRWAIVILLANHLLTTAIEAAPVTALDLMTRLLSVGVFQYMAWYAVLRLIGAGDRTKTASGYDWLVALGFSLMVFLPTPRTIWIAATAIGLYLALVPAGDRKLRSAGVVLVALSTQELWGHELFELAMSPLLRAETAVVGTVLQMIERGAHWQDNMITANSGWGIIIYPFCSSFHNLSLAILCWVTISRLASDTWSRRDFAVGGLIALAMILMNMTRLLLMSLNQGLYHYWHDGPGSESFAIGASLFVLLASLSAVRRAGERT